MILSIDCGSTNHKVALFDNSLKCRATCSHAVKYTINDGARAEFDAEEIWRDTVGQIQQVCQSAEIDPSTITTITLAGQAQTFVILDEAGEPIMPFISWLDKRAARESSDLAEKFGGEFHRHCSFSFPSAQVQLSKLLWLSRRYPERLTPAHRIFSLPGFLAWRLGGLHITDTNLAAMSGLYSCLEHSWWEAAIGMCGVRDEQLGELVSAGQPVRVRHPCPPLGFSAMIDIVLAGNDQTAGAFANGGGIDQVIVTLGTALVVYRHAGQTVGPYHPGGCWGPYPGGGFYELAARDEGCAALDWAIAKLMPGNEDCFMRRAGSAKLGAALFYPQSMRTENAWAGPEDLGTRARAVLEGLCFSARQLIESDLKLELSEAPVTVIGGGSSHSPWLQILSDSLDRPVRRGQGNALLGAAMMARPGCRPQCPDPADKLIEPNYQAAQYEPIYRRWREGELHLPHP